MRKYIYISLGTKMNLHTSDTKHRTRRSQSLVSHHQLDHKLGRSKPDFLQHPFSSPSNTSVQRNAKLKIVLSVLLFEFAETWKVEKIFSLIRVSFRRSYLENFPLNGGHSFLFKINDRKEKKNWNISARAAVKIRRVTRLVFRFRCLSNRGSDLYQPTTKF